MNKALTGVLISFFVLISSCQSNNNKKDGFTVHFETCTEAETNYIEDQHVNPGEHIVEPTVVFISSGNSDTRVGGWYKEKSYNTKWNFDTDIVNSNLTLYAKWADVISIRYYLKGSSSPIWLVNDALQGEPLERHDELCDGYEFYGYFTDPACTEPFDLNKPLEEDTEVYLYRGDTLSMNAHSIKRRFSMMPAGGSGSTTGFISDVKTDPSGIECVDVNFGYSTSGDPYMIIANPQIDISHSQKLTIKFKNFGGSTDLAFYWVSKYADGSYASGVVNDDEANAAHFKMRTYECFMNEDDPWIEREFDLSSKLSNGVSPWANSVTLMHLRIQFGYISRNITDLSNVVRIASITSTPDETYKGFNDSKQISDLLNDDNETDLINAGNAQEQNRGVVFPKNNDTIQDASTSYYKKTNGLLLYSAYGEDVRRYFFDVSSQNIEANKFSYITIKFKNMSYISSFMFYVTVTNPSGTSKNNTANVAIPIRMKSADEVNINFYGKANMVGIVKSFSILFNFNGVDNAILLESITMSDSKSFQIPGFNFDDPKFAGFTSNSDVSLSFNQELSCTSFTSQVNAGLIQYDLPYQFDITPYKKISLSYFISNNQVDSLTIRLKINGIWKEYSFTQLTISNELQISELDLESTGILQSITIRINGQGTINISAIEFGLDPATSCDLSSADIFGGMLPDWSKTCGYAEDKRATLYKDASDGFRYYFGFLYKYGFRDYPNISLEGKSYIYLIYQNQRSYGNPFINIYATNSDVDQDYLTNYSETQPIIGDSTFNVQKNMDENSWLTVAIPIPTQYTNGKYYLSNFYFASIEADISLYIRGIAVI